MCNLYPPPPLVRVSLTVRDTLTVPGQPRMVSHVCSLPPCQSIPDSQRYSDSPRTTTDGQPCMLFTPPPPPVRVSLTVRDILTVPGQPRMVSHVCSLSPCQSIPDSQRYSDSPRTTADGQPCMLFTPLSEYP